MFARRTKTFIKPMFKNEFETIVSDIGSQTIVVRRANIRYAPTLVSDIGWISITTIYPKTYDRLLIDIYCGEGNIGRIKSIAVTTDNAEVCVL